MYSTEILANKTKLKISKGQTAGQYCKLFEKKQDIYVHDKNTDLVFKLTFKPDGKDESKFVVTTESKKKYNFIDDTNPRIVSFEPLIIAKTTTKKFIYFMASENFDFYE